MKLAEQSCEPPREDQEPLSPDEADELMDQIPAWGLQDGAISRELEFEDFDEAMDFVNDVAEIAEAEDHHPDICISYNQVTLMLSTHKIGGLSMNDFIMAAKIDRRVR